MFSANSERVSNLPRSPQRRSSPESNSSEYFTPTGPSGDQCKFRGQVIIFEIDCAIVYTNLHELFSQFINSGKFMENF